MPMLFGMCLRFWRRELQALERSEAGTERNGSRMTKTGGNFSIEILLCREACLCEIYSNETYDNDVD